MNDYIEPPARTQVGAVLTFPEGVTLAQVRDAIAKLGQDVEVETEVVHTYNAVHGGPVFYIP